MTRNSGNCAFAAFQSSSWLGGFVPRGQIFTRPLYQDSSLSVATFFVGTSCAGTVGAASGSDPSPIDSCTDGESIDKTGAVKVGALAARSVVRTATTSNRRSTSAHS